MGKTFSTGLLTNAIKTTSANNVGIGTSSPASLFHIYASGTTIQTIETGANYSIINLKNTTRTVNVGVDPSGLYFDAGSTGIIASYAGGSERMRITSTGNVGIGTSSPNTYLTINDGAGSRTNSQDFTANGNSTKGHIGQFNNKLYISSNWYYNGNQNADSTSFGQANIVFDTQNVSTGTNINFGTSEIGSTVPIERMKITSTPAGGVIFNHTNGFETKIQQNSQFNAFYNGGGASMYLNYQGNGPIYAGSSLQVLYNGSDERIKDNITVVDSTLDKVLSLVPKTFNYKDNNIKHKKYYGFVAQDVEKIFPELVNVDQGVSMCNEEEINDRLSVESYSLVWTSILVKAIQEQNEIITKQGQAIDELKALIASK